MDIMSKLGLNSLEKQVNIDSNINTARKLGIPNAETVGARVAKKYSGNIEAATHELMRIARENEH